eukprot:1502623-Rhodomonas_salina.2
MQPPPPRLACARAAFSDTGRTRAGEARVVRPKLRSSLLPPSSLPPVCSIAAARRSTARRHREDKGFTGQGRAWSGRSGGCAGARAATARARSAQHQRPTPTQHPAPCSATLASAQQGRSAEEAPGVRGEGVAAACAGR